MDQIIVYAQRSLRQHRRVGTQGLPNQDLPDTVHKQVQRDRVNKGLPHTESDTWMRELDEEHEIDRYNNAGLDPFRYETSEKGMGAKKKIRTIHHLNEEFRSETNLKADDDSDLYGGSEYFDARSAAYDPKTRVSRKVKIRDQPKGLSSGSFRDSPAVRMATIDNDDGEEVLNVAETLQGTLSWHFSSVESRVETQRILQNIEGSIENGEVLVVIGDRESRKGDFLRLLSGRCIDLTAVGAAYSDDQELDAEILRQNTAYLANFKNWQNTAYMAGTQSGLERSVLIPELTVQETLSFVYDFVTPRGYNNEKREAEIESIMKAVDIYHLAEENIGRGNTGLDPEAKVRLNLATVMLQKQPAVFLDEPTKGLDLLSTESVVETILELSQKYETKIIISMEHPTKSLLDKFTSVLFLVRGSQFYFGPARYANNFFQRINKPLPEETSIYDHVLSLTKINSKNAEEEKDKIEALLDFASDVLKSIKLDRMSETLKAEYRSRRSHALSIDTFVNPNQLNIHYRVDFQQQLWTLLWRMRLQFGRDYSRVYVRIVLLLFWACILWFCLEDVARDGSFVKGFDVAIAYWLALFGIEFILIQNLADIQEDCRQAQADLRANLYKPTAFVVAHVFFKFLATLFLILPYSVIIFFVFGMDHNTEGIIIAEKYGYMVTIMLMLGTITECISSIAAFTFIYNFNVSFYVCMWLHIFFSLFSGGLFRWCNTPEWFRWVSYVSPTKFSLEGLLLSNWEDVTYSLKTDECAHTLNGLQFGQDYFCTNNTPWVEDQDEAFGWMIGWMSFYAFVMLYVVNRVQYS